MRHTTPSGCTNELSQAGSKSDFDATTITTVEHSVNRPLLTQGPGAAKTVVDAAASIRMRLLRFPLAVLVVFAHASDTEVRLRDSKLGVADLGFLAELFKDVLSGGLARTSVPVSLLLAGYLLAVSFGAGYASYIDKLRSKARTLLVPLLFWNVLVLAVYALVQTTPITASMMSGRSSAVLDFGLFEVIAAVLGIGRAPIAFQFWFIRDLIILTVLSPLLLQLIRLAPWLVMVTLFALWMTELWPFALPSCRAALFFCAGLLVGDKGWDLFKLDPYAKPIVVSFALILIASAWPSSTPLQRNLHLIAVTLGVPALLCLSGWVLKYRPLSQALMRLSATSFFVFAAHEPLMTIVRKLAFVSLEPISATRAALLYLLVPVLVIAGLVWTHRWLMKKAPSLTSWATGGRNTAL
jgi:fucose 4-O-acetylase-like acetyltransferase